MNKTVYLGMSILELSKAVMYEIWYDYVKPKHDEKQFCHNGYKQFYCICKNRRY